MSIVNDLLAEIKESHSQVSSSAKDELRVMQAMLNDQDYEVDIYSTEGKVGTYCPAKDFRNMQANIISSVTKMSKDECHNLADNYVATKSDATTMINISKEFTNTYLETGRKLPFGGREKSNYSLSMKVTPETVKKFKIKSESGNSEIEGETLVPAHNRLKAKSSCPSWTKASK